MRQVRVKIEGIHPVQQPRPIQPALDLYRRGGTVGLRGGVQSKSILHGHTESRQERAGETAEALLRRESPVPVMMELRLLLPATLQVRMMLRAADIMVRRDNEEAARPGQKRANGPQLPVVRLLSRSN